MKFYKLMKTLFSVLVLLFFYEGSYSQDFTDTRKRNESFVRLQPPVVRSEVAHFSFKGISESAQAPKLREITPLIVKKDSLVFKEDNIYAKVNLVPFDPKAHKLNYDEKTLIRIDRRTYYGNYGNIPATSIGSVLMIIDGDTVNIPPIAYQDLHNMNFTYLDKGILRTRDAIYFSKDGRRLYLYLFSKDNTGSYEVTFIFQDKQYARRVLDYGFL